MLRTFDDPVLHTECAPVDISSIPSKEIEEMKTELRLHEHGCGLAAPQIGHSIRVILVQFPGVVEPIVMINPEVTALDGSTQENIEGCLSFPGVKAKIRRSNKIKTTYFDEQSNRNQRTSVGFEAAIVQHEVDHLNGICRVGDKWKKANK